MNIITHIQFGDNMSALYNKSYLVAECKTHFTREHSSVSPETKPRCSTMEVTVVAPSRDDLSLYEWYYANTYQSGCIVFDIVSVNARNNETIKRPIYFEDAQCYAIKESYDIEKANQRLLTLYLSIQQCTVEGVEFRQQSANSI